MAKVIMICGKVCSGKSTYAEKLRKKENAVLLSADEIMLSIFGQNIGEKHDEYSEKIKSFLLSKTPEFIDIGTSVILDWGFWTRHERNFTRDFFQSFNIFSTTGSRLLSSNNSIIPLSQAAANFGFIGSLAVVSIPFFSAISSTLLSPYI